MNILNKFKNMFTEEIEEEIEEPVKKEMIRVEIPSPKEKPKKEMPKVSSRVEHTSYQRDMPTTKSPTPISKEAVPPKREETIQKPKEEEKFTFPVFFDDDDFDTLDKKVEKKAPRKIEPYGGAKKEVKKQDTSRKFKPTPIISPIYGILDKNYKKEDITSRVTPSRSHKEMTIDDLRKKAYGTLEDDLENSLLNDTAYDRPATFREENDMFDDLNLLDDDLSTYEAKRASLDDNMVKKELEKDVDKQAETDLFELIDTMYEKGDHE